MVRSLLIIIVVSGLQGCYYAQAVSGQLELLAKREPIAELLADPDTPPALRARLEYALAAREFASRELALPDNDSYSTYVDLEREYPVWTVTATPRFSVQPLTWCFPFVGCLAYRGYFERADAERFAARLAERGHDVRVGGSAAYSTLGWFSDPLLSSMLARDDLELAAVIFHELAHQVVYLDDQTGFNEAFATVVEEEGMRRWLAARGRGEDFDEYHARRQRRREFAELLQHTRDALAALYASELDEAGMAAAKRQAFEELRSDYRVLRDGEWGGYAGYDAWFARDLNNADLAAVATYHARAPALRALLASLDHDLEAFYAAAPRLAQPERNTDKRLR